MLLSLSAQSLPSSLSWQGDCEACFLHCPVTTKYTEPKPLRPRIDSKSSARMALVEFVGKIGVYLKLRNLRYEKVSHVFWDR
jgi:hypothetical protein